MSHGSPTRSQVPSLPPLVAPWQQEETSPNRTRPQPHTSPSAPAPSSTSKEASSSGRHHRGIDAMRLEKLESRVTVLEQANGALPGQLDIKSVATNTARDVEQKSLKEELARISSEINTRLERIEHRVLLNERSIHTEEARLTTLVQSTQEIERGILDGQRQLLLRREDQGARLEGVRESVHQLEQRQLQLGEFGRQAQAGCAMEVGRVGEEVRKMKSRMENMKGDVGGKLKDLERGHRVLEDRLLVADAAVAGLENTCVLMKKQIDAWMSEMRTTHSDLQSQLVHVEKEREKQDMQLRESFMQVQAQMQRSTSHLQEMVARELEEKSKEATAENIQLRDEVLSVIQYSQQECGKAREGLKRELEKRIIAVEEALESERKVCASRLEDLCSAVRSDCEKSRSELDKEITAKLQRGMEVLQGAVSVVEEEGKASRQELLAVVEAEIKTRHQEGCKLQSQYQRLSQEWHRDSQSLKSSLEATEERATIDREQLQSVQDALVSEWQEIGVRLLSDIDSRISAVHTHIANLENTELLRGGKQDMTKEGDKGEGPEGEAPTLLSNEVLQWKREVSQQLGFMQRQQGDGSQQMAGLNHALEELQIKLVGAIQRETNQRFHAVLELKNEMAQMAARMPLLHHPRQDSPDHHDSLDTSHSSQYMSELLHHQQQRTGTPLQHQNNHGSIAVSRTSFYTEKGEGEWEAEEDDVEGDYPYHNRGLQNPPEQLFTVYGVSGSHNPLHSKSQVLLSSQRPKDPPNRTLELPDIAENEAELLTVSTPLSPAQQQGLLIEPVTESGLADADEDGLHNIHEGAGDIAEMQDSHTPLEERHTSFSESSGHQSGENEVRNELEDVHAQSTLESEGQELEGDEMEAGSQEEGHVVWSIGEHN